MNRVLLCGRFELSLARPLVMGVVNLTPDSFSDGGRYVQANAAIAHARRLVAEGADILDLGGESTRPGAHPVSEQEELRRVLPVLEALRDAGVPVSVDTAKPAVMRAVLAAGADMINDVTGFRAPDALAAVAASGLTSPPCGLCAMHMQGEPRTMQDAPVYQNVVTEVARFLAERAQTLRAAGVDARRIVLDPGIGFGKTVDHNIMLLRGLTALRGAGQYPLLIGLSRKSLIGQLTGKPVDERLAGSLAGALASVARGAAIVRVHDVAATVDALAVWRAVQSDIFYPIN